MSIIDLGITAKDAEKAGTGGNFPPLPEDDYELSIHGAEQRQWPSGRPNLNVRFDVINHPQFTGRVVFKSYPLPWINTRGEEDSGGIGMLHSLFTGCGTSWEDTSFDTEDLIGATCKARVIQKARMTKNGDGELVEVTDENGNPVFDNDIRKVYPA